MPGRSTRIFTREHQAPAEDQQQNVVAGRRAPCGCPLPLRARAPGDGVGHHAPGLIGGWGPTQLAAALMKNVTVPVPVLPVPSCTAVITAW